MSRLLSRLAFLGAAIATSIARGEAPASAPDIDYARQVAPILSARCLDCHGAEAQEAGLRIDRRASLLRGGDSGEPAVVPNQSDQSRLLRLVAGLDEHLVMPPDGERLSAEEIAVLRTWIDQGAKMPDEDEGPDSLATGHWSFQPVRRPRPPAIDDPWIAGPIDAFVLAKLRESGLSPSPAADRRALVRRLWMDMLGLWPSPEEIAEFVDDGRPNAYERLVERVLADPRHGERWGRHWLDVVRFAESNGFETNHERPTAWRYRDYVIDSLNGDKPYDRFVLEQLAGDRLGADAATGFLVGGPWDNVKSPDPVLTGMQRQNELADIVGTVGTSLLGLTLACARCHNHKFDPVRASDYYALQAVFAGVQHGERELKPVDHTERLAQAERLAGEIERLSRELAGLGLAPAPNARHNIERFDPAPARWVRFSILATNSGSEPCLDELEIWTAEGEGSPARNLALAAGGAKASSSGDYAGNPKHRLEHIFDGQYGNDRSWISSTPGAGWVEIELPEAAVIDRIEWGRDRQEQFADRLPTDYRIETAVEPGAWKLVASSAQRMPFGVASGEAVAQRLRALSPNAAEAAAKGIAQLERAQQQRAELLAMPKAYAGRFEQPSATHRLYRGDPMAPREEVAPETLAVLHSQVGPLRLAPDAAEHERREAFARWVVAANNPLTARVIANRIWQGHFGRGLVATPSDFGAMGAAPSHPELLDWLADELVRGDWSLKRLHRLILLSNTYQQSSQPRGEALSVDASSALLWRYPPRRIEAEAIRDSMLQAAGSLDLRTGGPGFLLFHPNANYARNWVARDDFQPGDERRMVYALKLRMEQDAVFGVFDCPDGGQIAPARSRSTTAIQALNLFNSPFAIEVANRLAARAQRESGDDAAAPIDRLFQLALGRSPSREERAAAAKLAEQHGLAALCRAMLNSNEFLFVP